MKEKILIIEDEMIMRVTLNDALKAAGYEVNSFEKGLDALDSLRRESYSLMISDIRLPDINGLDLLNKARESDIDIPVIIMTAFGTIKDAVKAMKLGAVDYITKPFSLDEFMLTVQRALEVKGVREENLRLKSQLLECYQHPDIVGDSPAMKRVFELVNTVAGTDATVLILGESGTGKELIASSIHYQGHRKDGPLIKVNCAAIPETLIESELFGYEKGAFTGAQKRKPGRFELAGGGTIFLDEIADMNPMTQAKILRVLQDSTFERLGGSRSIHVDVRVIAATNKKLVEEVDAGHFREDLYHRLNVFSITLPPLRERREDIPMLADHFINNVNIDKGYRISGISDEALTALHEYSWPGNIRELENTIWRAAIIAGEGSLKKKDFLFPKNDISKGIEEKINSVIDEALPAVGKKPFNRVIGMIEKNMIKKALDISRANQVKAAEFLGITRVTLRKKIEDYDIKISASD